MSCMTRNANLHSFRRRGHGPGEVDLELKTTRLVLGGVFQHHAREISITPSEFRRMTYTSVERRMSAS
jgi:hypothetical protein